MRVSLHPQQHAAGAVGALYDVRAQIHPAVESCVCLGDGVIASAHACQYKANIQQYNTQAGVCLWRGGSTPPAPRLERGYLAFSDRSGTFLQNLSPKLISNSDETNLIFLESNDATTL